MNLYVKTRAEIYKINHNIKVVPYCDNYILPEEQRFYVLLIDNNYEVGYFKTKEDAIKVLNDIFNVLQESTFAVTNIIVYNIEDESERDKNGR